MAKRRSAPRKRPIRLADLFRLRAVGRPAISPDSRQIVFELKRFDFPENRNFTQLMIVDAENRETRALTAAAKHSDTLPRWSLDGTRVAFVSDRDKGTCLFVLPLAGGEARRLTPPDGFVHDFAWSPDGRLIAYAWQAMSQRQILGSEEVV